MLIDESVSLLNVCLIDIFQGPELLRPILPVALLFKFVLLFVSLLFSIRVFIPPASLMHKRSPYVI